MSIFRLLPFVLGLGALLTLVPPASAGLSGVPAPQALIYGGYLEPADFSAQGTASVSPGLITLTDKSQDGAAGSAFLLQRVTTQRFVAGLKFRIDPGAGFGETSGDGFTFLIAKSPDALGTSGTGMGLDTTESGGFAVEFDTWKNSDFGDPDGNHVALVLNGNIRETVGSPAPVAQPFDDGQSHYVTIAYEALPEGGHVIVVMDGQLCLDVTDPAIPAPDGYFGFSAGTGAATATHMIEGFALEADAPPSTPGARVRATGKLRGPVGFQGPLALDVSSNSRRNVKGRIELNAKSDPFGRKYIHHISSLVVTGRNQATIYGIGPGRRLVRVDVVDGRDRETVRLVEFSLGPYKQGTLPRGRVSISVRRDNR
ncbi:MAG: L-type lectin-domain containing protein [Armatimonadota bacterium]